MISFRQLRQRLRGRYHRQNKGKEPNKCVDWEGGEGLFGKGSGIECYTPISHFVRKLVGF